jgi:hypothetical protein
MLETANTGLFRRLRRQHAMYAIKGIARRKKKYEDNGDDDVQRVCVWESKVFVEQGVWV